MRENRGDLHLLLRTIMSDQCSSSASEWGVRWRWGWVVWELLLFLRPSYQELAVTGAAAPRKCPARVTTWPIRSRIYLGPISTSAEGCVLCDTVRSVVLDRDDKFVWTGHIIKLLTPDLPPPRHLSGPASRSPIICQYIALIDHLNISEGSAWTLDSGHRLTYFSQKSYLN